MTGCSQKMKQPHDRECFEPIHKEPLSPTACKQALGSLIFLTKKKNAAVKTRCCANGSTQRERMSWEEVSGPTLSTESTTLTATIEAHQGRDPVQDGSPLLRVCCHGRQSEGPLDVHYQGHLWPVGLCNAILQETSQGSERLQLCGEPMQSLSGQ